MTLYEALLILRPQLTPDDFMNGTVLLQNDGEGDYIKEWNSVVEIPSEEDITYTMSLPRPFNSAEVQEECRRRIYAKASDNAQKNMTANYVAGLMSEADQLAYKAGVEWIRATQMRCRELIASQEVNFKDDSMWPVCPPESEELATRY